MKKKIVSLLTIFCLMLPCFFAVACKTKGGEPKGIEAYTYSVVLKNAKGKIDANALQTEYDYKKEENVGWTNFENDYSLSVTRTSAQTDSLDVSLLEGFDYSNLSFSVNSIDAEAEIKSGSKTGCEKDAYLTDRQFHYSYEDMKSDTSIVVDFADCNWAKVSVDFSELVSQGISCYTASDEFVTINTSTTEALDEVTSTLVEVDYGTIFAFDCAQKLVFKPETSENFQDLTYSKYASRYYFGNNMIQYFTAKRDGGCKVYNAVKDYSKRGTLRILDCVNVPVYASLEDLQAGTSLETEIEKESYGGSLLNLNVVSATRMFFNLDADAQEYKYYLLDGIDDYLSVSKQLEPQTLDGTEIVYLDIDIANEDGSLAPAKYLVRAPKTPTAFYVVCPEISNGEARIANADYVLIGSQNTPTNLPEAYSGNIFFGFKESKDIDVEINPYTSDIATDYVLKQSSVSLAINYCEKSGTQVERPEDKVLEEPVTSTLITVDCFNETDTNKFYELIVNFVSENISNALVYLDASKFELYEDETVLYTTNILDEISWKVLSNSSELSISSEQTRTIYYYFDSNRADSFLQIQDDSGEIVSMTTELRDCFGRQMTGSVVVGDIEINLSKICYLDIKPGVYSSYEASLLREFDKTYHSINLNGLTGNVLKVSIGGYNTDGSTFEDVQTLENFSIRYKSNEIGGTIYYYVDSDTNKFLQLKDSNGYIVSTNTYVMESVSKELQIDGKYVYRLDLVGDYYEIGEEFYLEVVDASYVLKNESNEDVSLYSDSSMTEAETEMIEGNDYYFVGNINCDYVIIDSTTNLVVDSIEKLQTIDGSTAVYKFTFSIPISKNYVSGTSFKLKSIT